MNSGLSSFQLNPAQTRFFFWFNGLAPIATCVVTPIVTNWQFKQSGLSAPERRPLVYQDAVRQGVSAVIGLITYFGGAWLTGKFIKNTNHNKSLLQLLGGTVLSFVGYGVIRPMISSDIVARWLNNEKLNSEKLNNQESTPPVIQRGTLQRQGFQNFGRQQDPASGMMDNAFLGSIAPRPNPSPLIATPSSVE